MGEYFKPWRRKIGVLTLVTACIFMGGWVRSYSVVDYFWLGAGTQQRETFSFDGVLQFRRSHQMPGSNIRVPGKAWGKRSFNNGEDGWFRNIDGTPLRRSSFSGVTFGSIHQENIGWQVDYATVPYWLIVIPLTILSAWLLLSQRRKPEKPVTTST